LYHNMMSKYHVKRWCQNMMSKYDVKI